MNNTDILESGLETLGIPFTDAQIRGLEAYIAEIELWNGKYKLVGDSGERLITRHILDSLSAVPVLSRCNFRTAADVGSGAGLPGIPLSLFLENTEFTLIEQSGRRAGFLRNAVSLLGIKDRVKILEIPAEQVSERFDAVLFRAFRSITEYYSILRKLAGLNGFLFAYKGRAETITEELDRLGPQCETEIIPVKVPFIDEERNFCLFTRL